MANSFLADVPFGGPCLTLDTCKLRGEEEDRSLKIVETGTKKDHEMLEREKKRRGKKRAELPHLTGGQLLRNPADRV